jgi:hypothetical protein
MNNIEIMKTISKYKVKKCRIHIDTRLTDFTIAIRLDRIWIFKSSHLPIWYDVGNSYTSLQEYMEKRYEQY